jgi:hypothetical protein
VTFRIIPGRECSSVSLYFIHGVKCLNSLCGSQLRHHRQVEGTYIIPIVGHPHLGPDEDDLAIVDDHSAVVWDVLVQDGPDLVSSLQRSVASTHIPMSQMIPCASSLCKILARTSQECNTVSPSRKWSRQPYPGISSSGPTRSAAPRSLAIAIDLRILS